MLTHCFNTFLDLLASIFQVLLSDLLFKQTQDLLVNNIMILRLNNSSRWRCLACAEHPRLRLLLAIASRASILTPCVRSLKDASLDRTKQLSSSFINHSEEFTASDPRFTDSDAGRPDTTDH